MAGYRVLRLFLICLFALFPHTAVTDETAPHPLSLQPERTLSYEVDEATWMSVDVSPDGRQLVVDVLGDLYLLPIAGGAAQPLSVGMAFDSQPRFSPDGLQVAFVSDRSGSPQLWVMDVASGETRQITELGGRYELASPSWSPTGDHLLVSQGTFDLRTYELWAYPLAGGSGVQITQAKAQSDTPSDRRHNALGAVYDPSGRYVYYARKYGGFAYNVRLPLWQIVRRDLVTGDEDTLTAAPGSAMRPLLSPDGQRMVYATRHEQQTGLRVRDLRSGDDQWLAFPVQRDEQESRFTRDLMPGYAFTPDGMSLITSRDGRLIRIGLADKRIENIPFTVNIEKPLVARLEFPYRIGFGPVKARVLRDVTLSPDGTRVAFAAFSRIYIHELNSGDTYPISPQDWVTAYPTWSPKGNELVYVSWTPEGGHIHRSRARQNARPRQLTEVAGFYLSPVWSRDGRRIVAMRGPAHERRLAPGRMGPAVGSDLIWLESGGGAANLIMSSRGLGQPHFGPEEDRIYLQSVYNPVPGKSRAGLISVRYDGTDRRDVLFASGPGIYNQGEDVGAQSMQMSPRGGHVLLRHAQQLYVVALLPHLPGQQVSLAKSALPLTQLTDIGADFSGWAEDGKTITWSVGNRFYQRPLDSITFNATKPDADAESAAPQAPDSLPTEALAEAHAAVQVYDIDLYLPRHAPEGVLVLTHATVLSMGAAGRIADATVVIRNDRIEAVGPTAELTWPESATVIDLQGAFILPGFVDTHAHFRVSRDVPGVTNAAFLANLAYGVTTGMDVQPSTLDLLAAQELVDAGLMLGPRTLTTGPGVFMNNNFRSRQHAFNVLSRYKDYYQVRNIKAYLSGSRQQRHWLIDAARELQIMPTTEGALDMAMDLTLVMDGFSGLEHNFPLPQVYADVIELAARSRVAYTPTLLVAYGGPHAENAFYTRESPHDDVKLRRFTPYSELAARTLRRVWFHEREYSYPEVAASAAKILRAGGQVGVGSHGQLQGLGFHWELWALASGGLSPLEALRMATLGGAQMLGIAQDVGSVEPGKLADLLVLSADPEVDLRHTLSLRRVVKGGEMYDADTLDQQWPEVRSLADQWWWHSGPEASLPADALR